MLFIRHELKQMMLDFIKYYLSRENTESRIKFKEIYVRSRELIIQKKKIWYDCLLGSYQKRQQVAYIQIFAPQNMWRG